MQVPHENGDHSKSDRCLLLFLTNQIFVLSLFSAWHLTCTSEGLRQINKTLPHFLLHYRLVPNQFSSQPQLVRLEHPTCIVLNQFYNLINLIVLKCFLVTLNRLLGFRWKNVFECKLYVFYIYVIYRYITFWSSL